MSNIVQISDFGSGRNTIATNSYQEADLQTYIDDHEEGFLIDLMGKELYDLFIADLDVNGVPQTARFTAIFNAFNEVINSCKYRSIGMKEMVKGLVYFYYVRDQFTKQNTVGVKKIKGENTEFATMQGHDLYTRFNNAGDTFEAIRAKMINESSTYPEYDGIEFEYVLNI